MKIGVSRKWKRRSRSRTSRDLSSLKISGLSSIWKPWNTRFGRLLLNLCKRWSLSFSKFLLVFRIFSELVGLIFLNCSPASRTFVSKVWCSWTASRFPWDKLETARSRQSRSCVSISNWILLPLNWSELAALDSVFHFFSFRRVSTSRSSKEPLKSPNVFCHEGGKRSARSYRN